MVEVMDYALDLAPAERVLVADRLYASVEETSEHREKWDEEIERRVTEYQAGRMETFSEEEVRQRIDKLLTKNRAYDSPK